MMLSHGQITVEHERMPRHACLVEEERGGLGNASRGVVEEAPSPRGHVGDAIWVVIGGSAVAVGVGPVDLLGIVVSADEGEDGDEGKSADDGACDGA